MNKKTYNIFDIESKIGINVISKWEDAPEEIKDLVLLYTNGVITIDELTDKIRKIHLRKYGVSW